MVDFVGHPTKLLIKLQLHDAQSYVLKLDKLGAIGNVRDVRGIAPTILFSIELCIGVLCSECQRLATGINPGEWNRNGSSIIPLSVQL